MTTTTSTTPGSAPGTASSDPATKSEQVKQAASQATDEGSKVAATAADEAKSVAGEASGKARDLLDEAMGQVSDQSRSQLTNLVGVLRSLGDDLQDMVQGQQDSGVAGDVVRQVADRAHAAGDRLDGREPSDVLDDLRQFARQRPAVFLGGALVAGVLVGRFARGLKDGKDSPEKASNVALDPTVPVGSRQAL